VLAGDGATQAAVVNHIYAMRSRLKKKLGTGSTFVSSGVARTGTGVVKTSPTKKRKVKQQSSDDEEDEVSDSNDNGDADPQSTPPRTPTARTVDMAANAACTDEGQENNETDSPKTPTRRVRRSTPRTTPRQDYARLEDRYADLSEEEQTAQTQGGMGGENVDSDYGNEGAAIAEDSPKE